MKKINLIGQRFGRLIVLRDTGKRCWRYVVWLCKCDCGRLTEVLNNNLRTGCTKSCGCLQKEIVKKINTIHGDTKEGKAVRLYRIWRSMKSRCYNPNHNSYKYYGGKGIKICDGWKNDYLAFKSWALANGYKDDLTIDRINPDGNYCPKNCRWIPKSENSRDGGFKRWREERQQCSK